MPLPTGGCASAACRMVHTISSIRALSCLSDSTAGTERQTGLEQRREKDRVRMSAKVRRRVSMDMISLHHLFQLTGLQVVCVCVCVSSYLPLPAQALPTEVQPYTPSLSAAPESFPTGSPPGRLHAHGARHTERHSEHDKVLQALCEKLQQKSLKTSLHKLQR